MVSHDDNRLHARIRAEFGEMPRLKLTLPQAARLFNLERTRCERVLRALVDTGELLNDGKTFAQAGVGRRWVTPTANSLARRHVSTTSNTQRFLNSRGCRQRERCRRRRHIQEIAGATPPSLDRRAPTALSKAHRIQVIQGP
jgi:hypothetical protein